LILPFALENSRLADVKLLLFGVLAISLDLVWGFTEFSVSWRFLYPGIRRLIVAELCLLLTLMAVSYLTSWCGMAKELPWFIAPLKFSLLQ